MAHGRTAGLLGVATLVAAFAITLPVSGKVTGPGEAFLAGRLLVAAPGMTDPNFARSVVCLVKHDAGGAFGLIVNRPLEEVPMAALLEAFGLDREGVSGSVRPRRGGPVGQGSVFVLHSPEWRGEGTEAVAPGIALSASQGVLRAMGSGRGPERALLVLGYSGWGPGQLEREMQAGAWVSVPADAALVLDGDDATKWQRALHGRVLGR